MSFFFTKVNSSVTIPVYIIRYVIQKLGWDVKSIMLKFPSGQIISLRIINENQG